jgi:hypothetical protein
LLGVFGTDAEPLGLVEPNYSIADDLLPRLAANTSDCWIAVRRGIALRVDPLDLADGGDRFARLGAVECLRLFVCCLFVRPDAIDLGPGGTPKTRLLRRRCGPSQVLCRFDQPIPFAGPLRLGHQSSCDCRDARKDDEELEGQGEAAIWLDVVNSHKQYGANNPDTEHVNESQHSDILSRRKRAGAAKSVAKSFQRCRQQRLEIMHSGLCKFDHELASSVAGSCLMTGPSFSQAASNAVDML